MTIVLFIRLSPSFGSEKFYQLLYIILSASYPDVVYAVFLHFIRAKRLLLFAIRNKILPRLFVGSVHPTDFIGFRIFELHQSHVRKVELSAIVDEYAGQIMLTGDYVQTVAECSEAIAYQKACRTLLDHVIQKYHRTRKVSAAVCTIE